MLRLRDTRHPHTAALLENAVRVAEYYGFQPVDRFQRMKLPAPTGAKAEPVFARRDERALMVSAKLCASCVRKPNETLLLWRVNANGLKDRAGIPVHALELHVVGAPHAFAEALLIIVADAIAADAGVTERVVSLNSIGSFESSNRFVRDVSSFLRRHIESISPTLRPRAAGDPLGTLTQLFEKGHPATARAPQAMEYLTEEERRRLWDLLEYLEVFGVPYELHPGVLGSRDFWMHSLFELSAIDKETKTRLPFAMGGKYDPLATRIAGKDTPAATISIQCEIRGKTKIRTMPNATPSLYFAHLGIEARRRALALMENLRRAGIPVRQSLMHERLGDQMEHARHAGISHLLLMGHKEAMEGTVLVREVATNAQEAVPVGELPSYLKRYKAFVTA